MYAIIDLFLIKVCTRACTRDAIRAVVHRGVR